MYRNFPLPDLYRIKVCYLPALLRIQRHEVQRDSKRRFPNSQREVLFKRIRVIPPEKSSKDGAVFSSFLLGPSL